ncbi:MAG: 4-hydroxybenzoate synthetase [Thiotrichaceae bacterium IS1]|nr:MAG: 4-hydroxybenzoate synthetase [Thiotrichaceae bacterium IS1]
MGKLKIMDKTEDIVKLDLYTSLHENNLNPSELSIFQRIILITDGTLTDILESYLSEKLWVIKLFEQMLLTTQAIPFLMLDSQCEVIERKILLQGKESKNNWLYAESTIVPARLDEPFRQALLQSQAPIGQLWATHRVETFKEIIALNWETAGELADFFRVSSESRLLCRTYRVFSKRQPIMLITEKFPESFFR